MFSIGSLSAETGVKVVTIRYYEKIGLIAPASRTEGNQRRYSSRQLERLAFICHARDLGFKLDDIRELISLGDEDNGSCQKAHEIAAQHLRSVKQRLSSLKRLEQELKRITSLSDAGHIEQCRVIESLADHQSCTHSH